jgi:hypothetical protein
MKHTTPVKPLRHRCGTVMKRERGIYFCAPCKLNVGNLNEAMVEDAIAQRMMDAKKEKER